MGSSSRHWLGRDCASLGLLKQDIADQRSEDVGRRRRLFRGLPSIVQEADVSEAEVDEVAQSPILVMDRGVADHEGGVCLASFQEPTTEDRHHLPCMVAATDDSVDRFIHDFLEIGEGRSKEVNKIPGGGDFLSVVAQVEGAPQPVSGSSLKAARRLPSCWITGGKPAVKRSDWQVPQLRISSRLAKAKAVMGPKTAWM
mmetsp:Transcript_68867/g.156055  ORF Transcript_68867/g.156055 Transcript_68867/m.156055 type:complete len:199 (-) Transcript_68867:97-693(-)